MLRIAYITAQWPYGRGEAFLSEEIRALQEVGVEVMIIPRNPGSKTFGKEAEAMAAYAIRRPTLGFRRSLFGVWSPTSARQIWRLLRTIVRESRNPGILLKNLAVLPKSVLVAGFLRDHPVGHIHSHWGTTTATMGYVISWITGIPWSLTLHRGDIGMDNMLTEKVRTATFVRCISEEGRRELLTITGGRFAEKATVIHMGVSVYDNGTGMASRRNSGIYTIVAPGNLLPVKGHKYLVDACSILRDWGLGPFSCYFYGDGPLKYELQEQIRIRKLEDIVTVAGQIPHENLLDLYRRKDVDVVVLPSINTGDGQHEGIPVSLMEAMAYGIPVVSTVTGGVPELLADGSGVMVEEKNADALAHAIAKLMEDADYHSALAERGRSAVVADFNSESIARALLRLLQANAL